MKTTALTCCSFSQSPVTLDTAMTRRFVLVAMAAGIMFCKYVQLH